MGEAKKHRFQIVFSGSGYAADAIAHLVSELEERGHEVALVSHLGLAASRAKSFAEKGMRGLKSVVRTVTGALSGDDPLGLSDERGEDALPVDVVVATTPELVKATRSMGGGDVLRVGLMTDLAWTPDWPEVEADVLVMPNALFGELCVRKGWREEAVKVAGVPLGRSFCRTLDSEAIRSRFGLSSEQGSLLLVIAEDVDPGRLERIVRQISLVDGAVQPLFYVGEDTYAGTVLRKAAGQHGVMARMFGVVDNLEEYYAACDFVLAEISHELIYPLLALDKPVLLMDADIDAIAAGAFLRDEGAAVLVPDLLRLAAELDAIMKDPEELELLREGAGRVVDQSGVKRIADALEASAREKVELIGQARAAETAASSAAEEMSAGGAFEVIGSGPAPSSDTGSRGDRGGAPTRHEERRDYEPRGGRRERRFEQFAERRLTAAEAKEELAALILMEREVEKRLGDATRYVGVWENRLDLARDAGADGLAREAERFLDNYRREESGLVRELDRVRDQKEKLKRRVRPGGGGGGSANFVAPGDPRVADLENRFRSMELDRDLDRLKDRLDDDD